MTGIHMTKSAYLHHHPQLGENVYIAPEGCVIGQVTLGDDCSIWPAAVLRGDVNTITVGAETNIQDGAVLHVTHAGPYCKTGCPLTLGQGITVGHQATLHGCCIEDHCLVGMGAIILDQAHLHPETFIAAGAVVPPNKTLESGYLWVGNPIRRARELTEDERAFIRYSAKHYVKLKNQYLT